MIWRSSTRSVFWLVVESTEILLVKVSAAVGAVVVLAAAPALFVSTVFAPVAFAPTAFESSAFINTQRLPSQIDNNNY
jgi:hypothetical protein